MGSASAEEAFEEERLSARRVRVARIAARRVAQEERSAAREAAREADAEDGVGGPYAGEQEEGAAVGPLLPPPKKPVVSLAQLSRESGYHQLMPTLPGLISVYSPTEDTWYKASATNNTHSSVWIIHWRQDKPADPRLAGKAVLDLNEEIWEPYRSDGRSSHGTNPLNPASVSKVSVSKMASEGLSAAGVHARAAAEGLELARSPPSATELATSGGQLCGQLCGFLDVRPVGRAFVAGHRGLLGRWPTAELAALCVARHKRAKQRMLDLAATLSGNTRPPPKPLSRPTGLPPQATQPSRGDTISRGGGSEGHAHASSASSGRAAGGGERGAAGGRPPPPHTFHHRAAGATGSRWIQMTRLEEQVWVCTCGYAHVGTHMWVCTCGYDDAP